MALQGALLPHMIRKSGFLRLVTEWIAAFFWPVIALRLGVAFLHLQGVSDWYHKISKAFFWKPMAITNEVLAGYIL